MSDYRWNSKGMPGPCPSRSTSNSGEHLTGLTHRHSLLGPPHGGMHPSCDRGENYGGGVGGGIEPCTCHARKAHRQQRSIWGGGVGWRHRAGSARASVTQIRIFVRIWIRPPQDGSFQRRARSAPFAMEPALEIGPLQFCAEIGPPGRACSQSRIADSAPSHPAPHRS